MPDGSHDCPGCYNGLSCGMAGATWVSVPLNDHGTAESSCMTYIRSFFFFAKPKSPSSTAYGPPPKRRTAEVCEYTSAYTSALLPAAARISVSNRARWWMSNGRRRRALSLQTSNGRQSNIFCYDTLSLLVLLFGVGQPPITMLKPWLHSFPWLKATVQTCLLLTTQLTQLKASVDQA